MRGSSAIILLFITPVIFIFAFILLRSEVPEPISVTSYELSEAYKTNKKAAANRFENGELIKITGTITETGRSVLRGYYVKLFGSVDIYPHNTYLKKLMEVKQGQIITVQCKMNSSILELSASDCMFFDSDQ